MRLVRVAVVCLIAVPAVAQVRLVVKPDGRKVIYNIGTVNDPKMSNLTWLAKQHNRRSQYDRMIEQYADQYNVDPILVRAVIQVESDFHANCLSNKGASGLMQLIPETAARYGVKDIFDPEENIRGGVAYLADLLEMFSHDIPRALAAYNAGEGAVTRHGGIPPYNETMTYVKRALTVYYGRPYDGSGAISFAAGRNKGLLRGGFKAGAPALAAAMIPGFRYLGSQ
ncbi:MAG TPA: lytic transglycosylase domain-containing protein [Thermoanaerobaculia bacterium]|nr:lytic transglycosylase domain-containing protein [Thermoanaerobaculia bacterium]